MREYYLAILAVDPAMLEVAREQLKTKEGKDAWCREVYRALDPTISARWGEATVDFESWYPFNVIPSEEYFAKITRDDNAPLGAQIPDEYHAEEVLLPNGEWDEADIFVTEDYEKNHLFAFFSVDV